MAASAFRSTFADSRARAALSCAAASCASRLRTRAVVGADWAARCDQRSLSDCTAATSPACFETAASACDRASETLLRSSRSWCHPCFRLRARSFAAPRPFFSSRAPTVTIATCHCPSARERRTPLSVDGPSARSRARESAVAHCITSTRLPLAAARNLFASPPLPCLDSRMSPTHPCGPLETYAASALTICLQRSSAREIGSARAAGVQPMACLSVAAISRTSPARTSASAAS
mmetsp:Transcript_8434/g.18804  ORF Transcript_8434/g.18804 Transcript_8434/m.18804 type:complete len:234 (+) Transcript_8434:823-1524(+)